ncbi:MAG: hypothetical protein M3347_00910 [Armatimonadota bacterium]|nr:hypothetical protein [Armatimonadota bacterium]
MILEIERYWFPRGTPPPMDGGFLSDPARRSPLTGLSYHPEARTLAQLAEVPCVFLLGESGLGKSTELEREEKRLLQTLSEDEVLRVELGQVSDATVEMYIFSHEKVRSWLRPDGISRTLWLLLDAYDEGLIGVPNLSSLLRRQLKSWPIERLRLRLTARPSSWPDSISETCHELWGGSTKQNNSPVQVYQLVPLRRSDVRQWAATLHEERDGRPLSIPDPDAFLSTVENKDLQTFAAAPYSLEFLLRRYAIEKDLRGNRRELREGGCLELCKEQNSNRLYNPKAVAQLKLDAEQRLAIATRIAGVTAFGDRKAIFWGPHPDQAGSDVIPVRDLAGGDEPWWPANEPTTAGTTRRVIVEKNGVKETVATGLFADAGSRLLATS